jgi:SAM-dependent methyltransferase
MHDHRTANLSNFVSWSKQHITGDEKGQAQIFLDHLFKAFGQQGVMEAGATFEFRVKNTKGGTAFADLVWKPKVLIEMKKRGADLADHLQQAFDYWVRLTPGRPRYVILCNFDEFRIYDFDVDISEPQDTLTLDELPDRYLALAFLFPTDEQPQFKIDRVKVTRAAADKLAAVYNRLEGKPGVGPEAAQRFVLQMLVALFSEDIGFLPKGFVSQLLSECTDPPKAFDLIQGLFNAMNTAGGVHGGRFKGVPYFNGGLFAHPAPVELDPDYEVIWLREAAENDWSHISPDIFGTLFQHSMGKEQRHAFGAHYTAPTDIMKIVKPTIVDPFRAAIDKADTLKELASIRRRLQTLRVLDPACGSGNFLYIAYREMRRLEVEINSRENELSKRQYEAQMSLSGISPTQFFGLDILPFAVELAKVTLAIAPKLASDELHTSEPTLPLANLDNNIRRQDALVDEAGNRAVWPEADVIIGNPPFLGAKRLKPEHGPDYVNKIRKAYPEVPGMADFCVYWFRRAADHLPDCTMENPFAGRAGLVGTQNIRNNQSRVGGLDHVVATGTIIEAVDNQPWSGEANVHVSIANWTRSKENNLIPRNRKLWSELHHPGGSKRSNGNANGKPRAKSYELESRQTSHINSALSDETDVSQKNSLLCNKAPKRCFQGKIPGYEGFMLDADAVRSLGGTSEVVVPYLTGRELLDDFRIDRWAIDFGKRNMAEAAKFAKPFAHLQKHVLPSVQKAYDDARTAGSDMVAAREEHLGRWWQFWNRRDELNCMLDKIQRYIACSRVTRRPIMVFLSNRICPSDLIQVFAFDDDYSFGVLQSHLHFEWFRTSSRLKVETDARYSVRSVFETFPWPQQPTAEAVKSVADAARNLRRVRSECLQDTGGLRSVYRLLELPGRHPLKDAHNALDAAVGNAYGFSDDSSALAVLFALNRDLANAEASGKPVTPPGIPSYVNRNDLLSKDCFEP